MPDSEALVLEILKQGQTLAMSVFVKRDMSLTVRRYSQVTPDDATVIALCQEIAFLLDRLNKQSILPAASIKNLTKTGQLLWGQLLTESVRDVLGGAGGRDLLLLLDEELMPLPWELLHNGNDFLCLEYNLGRLLRTTRQPAFSRQRDPSGLPLKMLVLANPTNDLDSAYQEGVHIKNLFGHKAELVAVDFKSCDIHPLYVRRNLTEYDLVHFAGHAEFNAADPRGSGWVLSQGLFSTSDVTVLAQTHALPSLVFSNACFSAEEAGPADEFGRWRRGYGLATAFLVSGVKHYIGTLRRIEDRQGFVFSRAFYQELIDGLPIGKCVRQARCSVIREYGIGALSWASYLFYGDPGFSFQQFTPQAAARRTAGISIKACRNTASILLGAAAVSIILYSGVRLMRPDAYLAYTKSDKLFLSGKNKEAAVMFSQLIKRYPAELKAYALLAKAYQRMGRSGDALTCYFEYARQSEIRGDPRHLTAAYISIGWTLQSQGEYPRAMDFYNKALSVSQKHKDKLNEALCLRRMAVWLMDRGDDAEAMALLMKSSEINRQHVGNREHRYNLACDYFDIGLAFTNKDDLLAAKEFYKKSQKIFEQLKVYEEMSDYYFNLGEIYAFEKQYQKALENYLCGLKIDLKQDNKPSIASDYNMIGELYSQMNNLEEAERCFDKAVALCKEISAPLELAAAYNNLADVYKERGRDDKAIEYLRLAINIYRTADSPDYKDASQELSDLEAQSQTPPY